MTSAGIVITKEQPCQQRSLRQPPQCLQRQQWQWHALPPCPNTRTHRPHPSYIPDLIAVAAAVLGVLFVFVLATVLMNL